MNNANHKLEMFKFLLVNYISRFSPLGIIRMYSASALAAQDVLFLLAIFPARNHRLLAFLLPKAAKGSKNALTPTSSADPQWA
ncbi:MAG: hypothetical protein LBN74_01475 [Prevotella sp.]|nr:hypothetical protein [Prevotella sp.]